MDATPRFQPVRPVRAYQRVVEQIEDAIARGDLRPGGRLPGERDLVEQFGVSRATVREALRVLEAQGLVRSRPGDPRGSEILPVTGEALQRSLTHLARLEGLGLRELVECRVMLETTTTLLAARRHDDAQLGRMRAAVAAMAAAVGGPPAAFAEADAAFHAAVAEAAGNRFLTECTRAIRSVITRVISERIERDPDGPALMARSADRDEQVLAAIARRDGTAASRLVATAVAEYYTDHLDPQEQEDVAAMVQHVSPGTE